MAIANLFWHIYLHNDHHHPLQPDDKTKSEFSCKCRRGSNPQVGIFCKQTFFKNSETIFCCSNMISFINWQIQTSNTLPKGVGCKASLGPISIGTRYIEKGQGWWNTAFISNSVEYKVQINQHCISCPENTIFLISKFEETLFVQIVAKQTL